MGNRRAWARGFRAAISVDGGGSTHHPDVVPKRHKLCKWFSRNDLAS